MIKTEYIIQTLDDAVAKEGLQNWDTLNMSYQTRSDLIEAKDIHRNWYAERIQGCSIQFVFTHGKHRLIVKANEDFREDYVTITGPDAPKLYILGEDYE